MRVLVEVECRERTPDERLAITTAMCRYAEDIADALVRMEVPGVVVSVDGRHWPSHAFDCDGTCGETCVPARTEAL